MGRPVTKTGEGEGESAIGDQRAASARHTASAGSDMSAGGTDGITRRRLEVATVTWIEPELRRVGILGGTFDPVHYGHLAIAEEVAEALALELILFVPAALPPHKLQEDVTPAEDRAAMVALAIEGNPKFGLCRIELERSGPSYTADTLQQLADEATRQSVARELTFILSADALAEFRTWHDPERVLALATLAVVPRPGSPASDREWALAQLPPAASPRIECVDTVRLATSSTEVRARAAGGRSIRYLVPPAVDAYIHDHRLYRSDNRERIT
jgi:nicotinate-nucleotide adenylyltransferase